MPILEFLENLADFVRDLAIAGKPVAPQALPEFQKLCFFVPRMGEYLDPAALNIGTSWLGGIARELRLTIATSPVGNSCGNLDRTIASCPKAVTDLARRGAHIRFSSKINTRIL